MAILPTYNPTDSDDFDSYLDSVFHLHDVNMQSAIPAIVLSYDRAVGEVTVKILVNNITYKPDGSYESIERPEMTLPVTRFMHGGFIVDAPLSVGDTGWVVASDRNCIGARIGNSAVIKEPTDAVQNIGPMNPTDFSLAQYQNGFFIPDCWGKVSLTDADGLVIRHMKSENGIQITEDEVKMSTETSSVSVFDKKVIIVSEDAQLSFDEGAITFTGDTEDWGNIVTDVEFDEETNELVFSNKTLKKNGDFIVGSEDATETRIEVASGSLSNDAAKELGEGASAGESLQASRSDHVHPYPTSWLEGFNYATESWVTDQNFATQSYVTDEIGKIQIPDVSQFITMTDVENKGYLTKTVADTTYRNLDDPIVLTASGRRYTGLEVSPIPSDKRFLCFNSGAATPYLGYCNLGDVKVTSSEYSSKGGLVSISTTSNVTKALYASSANYTQVPTVPSGSTDVAWSALNPTDISLGSSTASVGGFIGIQAGETQAQFFPAISGATHPIMPMVADGATTIGWGSLGLSDLDMGTTTGLLSATDSSVIGTAIPSAPTSDKVLTVKSGSSEMTWEDGGGTAEDPGSNVTSITWATTGTAQRTTWTANTIGLSFTIQTRTYWNGTELDAFYRTFTFDKNGRLYSISAETKYTVDTPVVYTPTT